MDEKLRQLEREAQESREGFLPYLHALARAGEIKILDILTPVEELDGIDYWPWKHDGADAFIQEIVFQCSKIAFPIDILDYKFRCNDHNTVVFAFPTELSSIEFISFLNLINRAHHTRAKESHLGNYKGINIWRFWWDK